jgi:RHS repeat-associated protein
MGQWIGGGAFAHALYHADGNGNVTCLIYTNQMIAAKYLYDPYGNMLSQYGSLAEANIYRFSSKEWNDNAGLYYYLYRFYDPNLQRWPNRDPLGDSGSLPNVAPIIALGGLNLFEFVGNRPTINYDSLGLYSSVACAEAIAAQNEAFAAWQKSHSDADFEAYVNALIDAQVACSQNNPPPLPPPGVCPSPTPSPYRNPPGPPPPQLKQACGWALVGGALVWVCRIIIILAPAGA